MEDQFVSYEIAIKLKELGFDEPCFAYYKNKKLKPSVNLNNKACARWAVLNQSSDLSGNDCIAPIWQQAFDWFRINYELNVNYGISKYRNFTTIYYNCEVKEVVTARDILYVKDIFRADPHNFTTYEEAREACLLKLIEICQLK